MALPEQLIGYLLFANPLPIRDLKERYTSIYPEGTFGPAFGYLKKMNAITVNNGQASITEQDRRFLAKNVHASGGLALWNAEKTYIAFALVPKQDELEIWDSWN